ncbi:unnamed protein product [Phytophthora fragariaefolia]|uniref:Unnamed protein product n=1 Tax=Phytophthora fragariaefolia TaxID=1490495 RepID=A0A9W6Y1Q4_9STRA|nr:unnamed protein product [Phytophthora fragariaefolia]
MDRRRSSRRGNPAAVAATARDIDFTHLWRQLRAVGWTTEPPTGLQNEWSYKSPDGSNVFLGESAVVEYAFQSGLLEEDETAETTSDARKNEGGHCLDNSAEVDDGREEQGVDRGPGAVGEKLVTPDAQDDAAVETVPDTQEEVAVSHGSGEDEYIRPSQIDTSVQLSQNSVSLLFGSSSESETDLSQAAVLRAFDISSSGLQAYESQRNAVAGLQMLSDASGLESESDSNEASALTAASPRRIPLSVNVDVNFVPDEENISDFESLTRVGVMAVVYKKMTVTPIVAGLNKTTTSSTKQREDALRSMQWSQVSKQYEADTSAYPGQPRQTLEISPRDRQAPALIRGGMDTPPVFSFDEGVLPATSKRIKTRTFISDKPHQYGSKLFMVCDARTAYCHRNWDDQPPRPERKHQGQSQNTPCKYSTWFVFILTLTGGTIDGHASLVGPQAGLLPVYGLCDIGVNN